MTDSKNINELYSPSTYTQHDYVAPDSLQALSLSGLRTDIAALMDLIRKASRR